jgi:hypothetical protein
MSNEQRKKVWIDPFQTRFTVRIVTYLVVFPIVVLNLLFGYRLWIEGAGNIGEQYLRMLRDYAPLVICLWLLVPVMAWDAIRFTHRLVGPMVRFRRTVQEMTRGEAVRLIKLREGDYLTEFRDEFNGMLESLQRRGLPVIKPNAPPQQKPEEQSA